MTLMMDADEQHAVVLSWRLLITPVASPSLDSLLCKGLMLHHVVEVVGRSAVGKSQVMYTKGAVRLNLLLPRSHSSH